MPLSRRETQALRRGPLSSLAGLLILIATLWVLAPNGAAAEQAGVIAAVEGEAQIGHRGVWVAAKLGDTVSVGDELRTGRPGRLRVVFRDQSVINIGDASHITIDTQVYNPDRGLFQSVTKLLSGKIRALVSNYYGKPGSSYEIDTATAVAGVRGTEFIVSYEPERKVTEVVGITGRVEVHSQRDRLAHAVFITSGEVTTVAPGEFPESPRWLDQPDLRQYLEGLSFIGTGRPESLTSQNPLVTGQSVPEPDRAPPPGAGGSAATSAPQSATTHQGDAGNLVGQPFDVLKKMEGGAQVRF